MTDFELEDEDLVRVTFARRAVDTADAYGVEVDDPDGDELVWLPRSVVEAIDEGEAWVPRWLAENEELDYE